jgi:hypothetical protein
MIAQLTQEQESRIHVDGVYVPDTVIETAFYPYSYASMVLLYRVV